MDMSQHPTAGLGALPQKRASRDRRNEATFLLALAAYAAGWAGASVAFGLAGLIWGAILLVVPVFVALVLLTWGK